MEFIKLANKLFEARQMTHVFHLQTHDESEHRALDAFYNDLLEHTDLLIEVFMGQYGLLEGYELITNEVKEKTALEYLESFVKLVSVEGKTAIKAEDTHLLNILDEITALTYKTIYKIKILNQ